MSAPSNCCQTLCADTEIVEVPGVQGVPGADGADGTDGHDSYTTVSANAAVPANVGDPLSLDVLYSYWAVPGQVIVVEGPSHYRVVSTPSSVNMQLTWLDYPGDVAGGIPIGINAKVGPSGELALGAAAAGSPEGAITASPGQTYLNTTDESFWVKKTGTNTNTGWVQIVAALILMLSLAVCFAVPSVQRTSLTTNLQTAGLTLITNIATSVSGGSSSLATMTNIANVAVTNSYPMMTNTANAAVTNSYPMMTNAAVGRIAADITKQPASANLTNWSAQPIGLSAVILVVDNLSLTNQLWFTNGVLYATNRYVF
jgi:hypothetical protein